jgi:hypothetical protein
VSWTNSTHSGDYFRLNFIFLDSSGVFIAAAMNVCQTEGCIHTETFHEFPFTNRNITWQFNSPRMDDEDASGQHAPRYRWSADFTFDATQLGRIASCTCQCSA